MLDFILDFIMEPRLTSDCLNFIDALIKYGQLPSELVQKCIIKLCSVICIEQHENVCWSVILHIICSRYSAKALNVMYAVFIPPDLEPDQLEISSKSKKFTFEGTESRKPLKACNLESGRAKTDFPKSGHTVSSIDECSKVLPPSINSLDRHGKITAKKLSRPIRIGMPPVIHGAIIVLSKIGAEKLEIKYVDLWNRLVSFSTALTYDCEDVLPIVITAVSNVINGRKLETLELDILSEIFVQSTSICNKNDLGMFHDDLVTNEKHGLSDMLSNLLVYIKKDFPSLSLNAQCRLFQALIKNSDFLTPSLAQFVLRESSIVLETVLEIKYVDVLIMFIRAFYCSPKQPSATRIEVLEIIWSSFCFDWVIDSSLESSFQKIPILLMETLVKESDIACFQKCLQWFKEFIIYFDVDLINSFTEILLQCVIGVLVSHGAAVKSFWEDEISRHKSIENVSEIFKSNLFTKCDVPEGHKIEAAKTFVIMFHILTKQRASSAADAYHWLCAISCWISSITPSVRIIILRFLSTFSANSHYQITYNLPSNSSTLIAHNIYSSSDSSPTLGVVLKIKEYAHAIITLLKYESSYFILQELLSIIPVDLHKIDFWKCAPLELEIMRKTVCEAILNESAAAQVTNIPATVKKTDIYLSYYRILLTLIAFHNFFSKTEHDQIVATLFFGLGRWPIIGKLCMEGLTLSIFELPNSMLKQIPAIVMKISQTTSLSMAIPNLEFLSSLARSPTLYVNFAIDDYKRVLGIALQYLRSYVNADTTTVFSQCVTQLGYHVVAVWFLSIKVSERRKYVPFVLQHMTGGTLSKTQQLDEPVELVLDLVILCIFDLHR